MDLCVVYIVFKDKQLSNLMITKILQVMILNIYFYYSFTQYVPKGSFRCENSSSFAVLGGTRSRV